MCTASSSFQRPDGRPASNPADGFLARGRADHVGKLWSLPALRRRLSGVSAVLTGLIGVLATLLGSFTTYLFQSRTAERSQAFEREERLRQERLNACSSFAGAMT